MRPSFSFLLSFSSYFLLRLSLTIQTGLLHLIIIHFHLSPSLSFDFSSLQPHSTIPPLNILHSQNICNWLEMGHWGWNLFPAGCASVAAMAVWVKGCASKEGWSPWGGCFQLCLTFPSLSHPALCPHHPLLSHFPDQALSQIPLLC